MASSEPQGPFGARGSEEVLFLEGLDQHNPTEEIAVVTNPTHTYKRETPQGTHLRWILDTGAAQTIAPRDTAPPGYTIQESPGSRRGQRWHSATGHTIPNEGTQTVPALTTEGTVKR